MRERSSEPEWLDQGPDAGEALRSLRDLRFVNEWLGGRRALFAAVHPHLPAGGALLDVGCGSGDVPAYLLGRRGGNFKAVGIDIKPLHLTAAPPRLRRVAADLRCLPFLERSFDVVTACLILHHFDSCELPAVLAGLFRLARRALVVSDLHRHAVPLHFGRLAFPLLFRSPVSVHDGLVSIRRGFRPPELEAAFAAAGIAGVRVCRVFPYRLMAIAARGAP
jgi:SAM-dependent methyltransferase